MQQRVASIARLEGTIEPPGDKSISHRAAIINAIAAGTARIINYSPGGDCYSTLRCLKSLGVRLELDSQKPGSLTIEGSRGRFQEPESVLNAGNSGTTMRLLSGVLAAQPFLSILTGDRSLRSRPMGRIIQPLRLMGAAIQGRQDDSLPPLVIRGGELSGLEYHLPVASAQLKSCLLLAGLFAQSRTVLHEPLPSRDHTEQMLRAMGATIETNGSTVSINPGFLRAIDVHVPADIGAAAFWLVAAAAHPNARLCVKGVGINPTRTGILDALTSMGAHFAVSDPTQVGGELMADITVESSPLRAVEINGELIPRLIDELPVLAVAACFAKGTTVIRNAEELRVKESDRITMMVQELKRMGAQIEELPDGMVIKGPVQLRGASCRSYGDHRLAMALAVAGLLAHGETTIHGAEAAEVSYPGFWEQLQALTIRRQHR